MRNKKMTMAIAAVLVAALLIISGLVAYLEFTKEEKEEIEPLEREIDNRISPLTNQGINIEINRIRHRGLMEEMLKVGTSWRTTPRFYWKLIVDGKEANTEGLIGTDGVFNTWDTITREGKINYWTEQEQETSTVRIIIVEQVPSGLFGWKTTEIEQEKIHLIYDYRTGRWTGDDDFMDDDGYGHYLGESFEVWFDIYQTDFDNDRIPYWTEINVLHTDPRVDDRIRDPDGDGIPTDWEWRWGYDPFTWDDHEILDPDVDGIENIEEYQMRKWFADPYHPDIYLEADNMEKRGLIDLEHVFYKESIQMLIEIHARHNINLYVDDGWPDGPVNGGGEYLPFVKEMDDVTTVEMVGYYKHNFADERKGIFRYVVICNSGGWIAPGEQNAYDMIQVGTGIKDSFFKRLSFTPRHQRVCVAKGVLHELGHAHGLPPFVYEGIDIMPPIGARYPNMDPEDYEQTLEQYHSIMNYKYIWGDRDLFDYSDGSNGPPYDQNDWEHIYLPTFQTDALMYEEPIDETFEDFEVIDKDPGVYVVGWEYDENLTQTYENELKALHYGIDEMDANLQVHVKTDANAAQQSSDRNIRVYAKPQIEPFPINGGWTLAGEGYLEDDGTVQFFSIQDRIEEVRELISEQE